MDVFHRYEQAIGWIVSLCPQPDKFAHTYAGLGIWLFSGLLLRKPLSSLITLTPVIALEIANECMDRVAHGSWEWHDTLRDMAATWFWPVVLCFCLRLFPTLAGTRRIWSAEPLAPSPEHHVDRALSTMAPVRAADRNDVRSVLADSEPV